MHLPKSTVLIIIIYVDDILVTGSCEAELQKFTDRLNRTFSLKDIGNAHYFLGIEIVRYCTCMFLSQRKYVQDLLEQFEMINCSTCPTPMLSNKQFLGEEDEELKNPTVFRKLIGALQYVTNTRPDICFAVNRLSRYLSKPSVQHWAATKRILR